MSTLQPITTGTERRRSKPSPGSAFTPTILTAWRCAKSTSHHATSSISRRSIRKTALEAAPACGLEPIASSSGGRKSGATTVSLLSKRTPSAPSSSATWMPALLPPANPRFSGRLRMRNRGKARRSASTVSGGDPLSTTITEAPPRSAASRLRRHSAVSAARFQLSTMIRTPAGFIDTTLAHRKRRHGDPQRAAREGRSARHPRLRRGGSPIGGAPLHRRGRLTRPRHRGKRPRPPCGLGAPGATRCAAWLVRSTAPAGAKYCLQRHQHPWSLPRLYHSPSRPWCTSR